MNRILTLLLCWTISHFVVAISPADKNANPETKALLINLDTIIVGNGILIGHQNDVIGGKSYSGWKDNLYSENPTIYNSDIWQMCGDYPAVQGFDIGGIGVPPLHQNSDWHNLEFMRNAIIAAYQRKAITTISYHMHNPITYDVVDSILYTDSILEDTTIVYLDSIIYTSSYHYGAWIEEKEPTKYDPFTRGLLVQDSALNDTLNAFLTAAGNYFNSLTTTDTIVSLDNAWQPYVRNITVPIIFRPYHELNGGHFWWGNVICTPEQYIALWRYTYTFLTETMGVHNLLYCYSPYGTITEEAYLERYPGDEYVDILGFEISGSLDFYKEASFKQKVEIMQGISNNKRKPIALTETGVAQPTISNAGANYFTEFFAELNQDYAKGIAYALFWRNLGEEWRVPYVGNNLANDFLALHTNRHTSDTGLVKFESDLSDIVLNYGLGPYVLHPDNFPTSKKEKPEKSVSIVFVDGALKVNLTVAEDCSLEIFNIKGQKLVSTSFVGNSFEKAFPASHQVFIVRVIGDTFQNTRKILVQ